MATLLQNIEGKRFIYLFFVTILSFTQVESNYGKEEQCERGCSWIIKFSHCMDFDTINMVLLQRKKCVK